MKKFSVIQLLAALARQAKPTLNKLLILAVLTVAIALLPMTTRAAIPVTAALSKLLTKETVLAIIIELAAGQALDAWLAKNPDPRQHNSNAHPDGPWWLHGYWRISERLKHGAGFPNDSVDLNGNLLPMNAYFSQPHEMTPELATRNNDHTSPFYMARVMGWMKTYEINDSFGPLMVNTWYGTRAKPFNAQEAIAGLREYHRNDELNLGILMTDRREIWNVGAFEVESKYDETPGAHPKLRDPDTYTVKLEWVVGQDLGYQGDGINYGKTKYREKFFQMPCHRTSSSTHNLVGRNEMLLSSTRTVRGNVVRWVEEDTGEPTCGHGWLQLHNRRVVWVRVSGFDGGRRYSMLVPSVVLAPECQKRKPKLVVKQRKTYQATQ